MKQITFVRKNHKENYLILDNKPYTKVLKQLF